MDPASYATAKLGLREPAGDVAGWEYIRIPCLGLLPGLCCPHHDRVQSNGVLRADDFGAHPSMCIALLRLSHS
eukprot:SAG31_NODE_1367_length_8615_cov_12.875763_4_plen_73_part_00